MLGRVAAKMITLSKKCLAFNAPPTILAGGNANETIEIATGMSTRRDCSDRNMEPSRYNRCKESEIQPFSRSNMMPGSFGSMDRDSMAS